MRPARQALFLMVAIALCTTAQGIEDLTRQTARKLLKQHREAIVTLKFVITTKMVMGGREMNKTERKSEVTGTVIRESGLTVLSNFTINPMEAMQTQMMGAMGGMDMKFEMKSDITDVKIVLADGTEIPADFVLRDKDLDLAFVKPKEKLDAPLPHVKIVRTEAPELLDETIVIGRLGREVKRVNSISLGYVQAIVKKPRSFYICDFMSGFASLGCPVFNANGETLGISVVRVSPLIGQAMGMMGGMQPVVVPAGDLLEVAEQAEKVETDAGGDKAKEEDK